MDRQAKQKRYKRIGVADDSSLKSDYKKSKDVKDLKRSRSRMFMFIVLFVMAFLAALAYGIWFVAAGSRINGTSLTLSNLIVTESTVLHTSILLDGDTQCTDPVGHTCLPTTYENLTLVNTNISGGTSCTDAIDAGCIPKDLVLDSLVVNNLTAYDFTHMNMMDLNETFINAETLNVVNSLTCTNNDIIAQNCFDISNEQCPNGVIGSNCIPILTSDNFQNNSITGSILLDNSVTTTQIQDGTIMSQDIGPGQITTVHILNGTILTDDIADSQITNEKIDSVDVIKLDCTTNKLSNSCLPDNASFDMLTVNNLTTIDLTHVNMMEVNHTMFFAEHMTAEDIVVTNSLTCTGGTGIDIGCIPIIPNSKFVDDTISGGRLLDGTVSSTQLATDSVTTIKIDDLAVTYAKVGIEEIKGAATATSGGITGSNILAKSINHLNIEDAGIISINIGGNQIVSQHISDGTILNQDIANGTINSRKLSCDEPLAAGCLSGVTIPVDSIFGATMPGTGQIAGNTIQSWNIANGGVANVDLAGGITSNKLSCNTYLAQGCRTPQDLRAGFAATNDNPHDVTPASNPIQPGGYIGPFNWYSFDPPNVVDDASITWATYLIHATVNVRLGAMSNPAGNVLVKISIIQGPTLVTYGDSDFVLTQTDGNAWQKLTLTATDPAANHGQSYGVSFRYDDVLMINGDGDGGGNPALFDVGDIVIHMTRIY